MEAQQTIEPIFSVKNVTMDFKVDKKGFLAKKNTSMFIGVLWNVSKWFGCIWLDRLC